MTSRESCPHLIMRHFNDEQELEAAEEAHAGGMPAPSAQLTSALPGQAFTAAALTAHALHLTGKPGADLGCIAGTTKRGSLHALHDAMHEW